MNEKIVTVFTPTYNRGYTLERLYESLLRQTDKRFCWLIVDDGSTDNTKDLVGAWIQENKISIEYYQQENQGKPTAHNKGVKQTKTELFFCVDSDDFLTDDAIFLICQAWENHPQNCIGILGYKMKIQGDVITKFNNDNVKQGKLRLLYEHGLSGDVALIFRMNVLKKYCFPKYEGEKFVPEAYLYDLMDQEGELLLLKDVINICEYLSDGYTAGMAKLLYNNPQGYFGYINQRLRFDKTIKQRFADSIRYDAMAIAHKNSKIISGAVYPGYALLSYPAGWLFYKMRYKKYQ